MLSHCQTCQSLSLLFLILNHLTFAFFQTWIIIHLPCAGEPSPEEKQVADVAVDLFRSPRSKGGFGEMADWADFPEPSVH